MIDTEKNISKVTYNGTDMPLATQSRVVTPTTEQQVITGDDGYTLTSVTVEAVTKNIDENIQPNNIKQGVTILGVEGVLEGNKLPEVLNKTVTSLTAGDFIGVTQIPSYAFQYCIDLTSVEFSSILQTIGSYAFSGCSSLTSIDFGENSQLTSIGEYAFYNCSGLTEVDLSNCTNLTSIGDYAFSYCSGLTSISLPSSLTSIGNYAFSDCRGLTGISLPSSLTSIGNYAFYGCSSLASIEIPSSVTSIGSAVFSGCSSLTSIEIPNSVTSIGNAAFYSCRSLTTMRIEATTPPTLQSTNAISTATTQIQVPMASVDAYKTATNWSNFADIIVGYTE